MTIYSKHTNMTKQTWKLLGRLGRDEAGALMIITAMLFPVLLAFMGLSLDFGLIYDWKRRQQKAADAAAIGAATELWRGNGADTARLAGADDAALNGFDGSSTSRDITVDINIPYNGSNQMVEAVITERQVPTYFLRVVGWDQMTVQSRAVSGLVRYASGCIHTLDPTERSTLKVNGTSRFLGECEVLVNSTHTRALEVDGGACLSAGNIAVTGDYVSNGSANCIDPPPYTDVPAALDSMAYMQPMAPTIPEEGPTADNTNIRVSNGETVTLSPGYYAGGANATPQTDPVTGATLLDENGNVLVSLQGYGTPIKITGGTVHFEPGTYILDSGMEISGGSVTGEGVTFYNTSRDPDVMNSWGLITISGNAYVNFSAPSDDGNPYEGMLFWEDVAAPDRQPGHSFAGTSDSVFTGALYFPSSEVKWLGSTESSQWTIIVADEIVVGGNAVVQGSGLNTGDIAPPVFKPTLLE